MMTSVPLPKTPTMKMSVYSTVTMYVSGRSSTGTYGTIPPSALALWPISSARPSCSCSRPCPVARSPLSLAPLPSLSASLAANVWPTSIKEAYMWGGGSCSWARCLNGVSMRGVLWPRFGHFRFRGSAAVRPSKAESRKLPVLPGPPCLCR